MQKKKNKQLEDRALESTQLEKPKEKNLKRVKKAYGNYGTQLN